MKSTTFLFIAILFVTIQSKEVFKIDTLVEGDGESFPP